jgi:hypothetical protein
MKKLVVITLSGAWLFFHSCKKADKESPKAAILSPTDSVEIIAGSDLPFAALITDNEGLSQYKIDIHENFEGHAHDKSTGVIWSKVIINNISGLLASPALSIPIPENAGAGWYHLILTAVDAAGNQSEFDLRNIKIKNPADTSAPEVTLTTPIQDNSYPLGQPITLSADIMDDQRIYIIQTRIRRPNSASNLFSKNDTLNTAQSTYSLNIPTTGSAWTSGNYELYLWVYDGYFNQSPVKIAFTLN